MNDWLYEAQLALDRSKDTLEDAGNILKMGMILAATNRTYYAIYYCIHALLLTECIVTKTHQGANVKFNELFIKTNKMPRFMAIWAMEALELRQEADYDFSSDISEEVVVIQYERAKEFYAFSKSYIEKLITNKE
jgi:uncharacterized protein (UPF0332 family)